MRVVENREAGTFTLTPDGTDEQTIVGQLLARLNARDRLEYNGQVQKGRDKPMILRFNAGGKPIRVPVVVEGHAIGTESGFDGGVTLDLSGSDDESIAALAPMRDMCFLASGGLIFLREGEIDGVASIVCTGGFCNHCQSPVIGPMTTEEHCVCDKCAKNVCEHEYEETLMLSPAFGLIAAEACKHCKRLSPSAVERAQKTPKLERLIEAQKMFGGTVFLANLGNMTLDEAVALRDHGTIPESYREQAASNPEVAQIFKALAEDMSASS